MKTKISITLSGWDAQILEEACTKIEQMRTDERSRSWLIKWAIRAYAAAIIQQTPIFPSGVELTHEDPEAQRLRLCYSGNGPTGLLEGEDGFRDSRWDISEFPE